MGHIGLTPQAISVIGGFRAQGRTAIRARELLDEALRLQDAGVFGVVLECVPTNVAAAITETLEIPTIGIGAGGETSGQVLVFHDMLGMTSHPHHEHFVPKVRSIVTWDSMSGGRIVWTSCLNDIHFALSSSPSQFCKRYAQIGHIIQEGLSEFKRDVESGAFPSQEYSPYTMKESERRDFEALLAQDADEREVKHQEAAEKLTQQDEYEKLHLYGTTDEAE